MKRNLVLLGKIYKIQWHNYLNDASAIVLGFVVIVIMAVCWMGLKPKEGDFSADPFILASALGVSTIRNAQYNFSNLLTDWSKKGTFKILQSFSVSKFLLSFAVTSFVWIISLTIMAIIFALGMLFPEQRRIIQYTNWPIFLSGLFFHTVLVSMLALLPQLFIKSANVRTIICITSYFGPMYLLGLGIPLNITGNVVWLNYFTYIFPHRYTLALIQSGFIWKAVPDVRLPIFGDNFPSTNIPIPGGVKKDSFLATHGFGFDNKLWLLYFLIVVWMLIFLVLLYLGYLKKYRFNLRKFPIYDGASKRIHYINQIRRASSLTELNLIINQINNDFQRQKSFLQLDYPKQKRRKDDV